MNVVPNLFYKSKDTPFILHNWKNEFICFYVRPKWTINGIYTYTRSSIVTIYCPDASVDSEVILVLKHPEVVNSPPDKNLKYESELVIFVENKFTYYK